MVTSRSSEPRTPSGGPPGGPPGCCEVVTVPAREGLEVVDILRRGAAGAGDAVGLVLHGDGGSTLGFLVPPGTAAAWDVPGSTCTETDGRGLNLAPDEPPVEGADWLLPPEDDAGPATDPAVLREALDEARRLLDAADACR